MSDHTTTAEQIAAELDAPLPLGTAPHERELYRLAMEKWGFNDQLLMLAGELGEVLTHVGRHAQGRLSTDEFASEIADGIVMLRQMAEYVGPLAVEAELHRKLLRLAHKLRAPDALKAATRKACNAASTAWLESPEEVQHG